MRMLRAEQKVTEDERILSGPELKKTPRMLYQPKQKLDLVEKGKMDTSLEALLPKDTLEVLHQNPNIYGTIGALYESGMAIGNFALDVIPGAKYLRPEDRERYLSLDTQHQVRAGLFEALGASLFTPGGIALFQAAGKGFVGAAKFGIRGISVAGKGVGVVTRRVKPRLKVKPIEDLGSWVTRDYETSIKSYLKKRRFSPEESEGIYNWFQGDIDALRQALIRNRLHGKKPSEAFEKVLVRKQEGKGLKTLASRQGVNFWLDDEFIRKLDPAKLRLGELHKKFIKTTSEKELLGRKYGREFAEVAFRTEAEKYYGLKTARKMTLKDATEAELVNFTESMLQDKRAVLRVIGTPAGSGISPVRLVFGKGEELGYGTYRGIYKRLVKAFGRTNEYTVARVNTCRAIWEQRGLGTLEFKKGKQFFKRAPGITKTVENKAFKVLQAEDNLMGVARKINTPEAFAAARNKIGNLINSKDVDASGVRTLVDATHDYFDTLYGEDALMAINRAFGKTKMSPTGRIGLEKSLAEIAPKLQELFSTGASRNYTLKHQGIVETLEFLKKAIPQTVKGRNRWFRNTGANLEKDLELLQKNLSLTSEKNGKFIEYLDSYVPRISAIQRGVETETFAALSTKYSPSYVKARDMAQAEKTLDTLEQLIVARTRAQAKRNFLYDDLGEVAKFASKLPESWRAYTEHFIARSLNIPSRADEVVAKWIGSTVGRLQKDPWTASRVMTLAKNTNDMGYMGFLGLKPFSAMRNLFQPFLLVPADLGGIKDYQHLVRGIVRATRKDTRNYLNQIGIITDYAPETVFVSKMFGASGKKWVGVPIPDLDNTRDFCLWMFKHSDMFNRYVTGASAMSKWETALKQVGGKVGKENLKQFMSKAGVNGRHSWIKDDIETLLRKGHFEDAEAGFIKDVVADTQFLYGKLDSPLIAQSMGGVGRTLTMFQSWWMNYGHLINKWMHTGQSPTHLLGAQGAKTERMITAMMSASAGYFAMEKLWGSEMAFRTTFLGPFPDLSRGFQLPPSWQPVVDAISMVGAAARTIQEGSFAPLGRQGLALLDSTTNFAPGALQAKLMYKATKKEGFPGFSKSILRLRGKGSLWED